MVSEEKSDQLAPVSGDQHLDEIITRGMRVQEVLNNWKRNYSSAASLASLFQREGIKGLQRGNCTCPVAVAIKKELGFVVDVSTSNVQAYRLESFVQENPHRSITYATLPPVVRDFVRHFDNGMFPELIEPEPPVGG